jgi:hypothetical protein
MKRALAVIIGMAAALFLAACTGPDAGAPSAHAFGASGAAGSSGGSGSGGSSGY